MKLHEFLIQSRDNEIIDDFAFHLKEAVKYNNWFYNEDKYNYYMTDDIWEYDFTEYIPIGSIEFVLNFYKKYHGIDNIKPINIPDELNNFIFLKRNVTTIRDLGDIRVNPEMKVFAKSIDKFKDFTDIVKFKDLPLDKNLLISNVVDILSEWRAFVFNGKLVDLRNYGGDFTIFPNVDTIKSMIEHYKKSPKAYTLDVAIINKSNYETALIEVHQFFSCGLYGFADYTILPQMFITTHNEILKLKAE